MPKRKLNGVLKLLAILSGINREVTPYYIQRNYGFRFDTLSRAINVLKEAGFITERYEEGPPPKRYIKLTEKGREAAACAKRILELAGVL